MSDTLSTSLGNGITLDPAGSYLSPFTIETTGTIDAPTGNGVYSSLTGATLINYGAVNAGVYGVLLQGGGPVINSGSAASIYGQSNGVAIKSLPATLVNQGTIASNGSEAVYVQGGTITNAAGATISSQNADGIYAVSGVTTTLTNAGLIISYSTASNAAGVYIQQLGYVTNSQSGVISGVIGVDINGHGTVLNDGTIIGSTTYEYDLLYEAGLELNNGYISNSASGVIHGRYVGVSLGYGSLYNAGTIYGSSALNVDAQATVTNATGGDIAGAIGGFAQLSFFNAGTAGGILIHYGYAYVSNASTGTIYGIADQSNTSVNIINDGLIEGGVGVSLQGGGTVTNAGTIYEPGGTAVYLGGTGTNELIVEPGGEIYGTVVGGPSSTNILSLAAGSGGTIDGLSGFQTVDIAAGATWSLVGDQAGLASGETINGFDLGDGITITDFAATSATYVSGVGLELISAASTITVDLTGNLSNGALLVANNGTASYIGYETNSLSSSIGTGITLVGVSSYSTRFTIAASGTIDAPSSDGVYSTVSSASLFNEGAVTAGGFGVLLGGGGYVSNSAGATIYGQSNGVAIYSTGATLINQGTIATDLPSHIGYLVGDAVYIQGDGTITNAAGATIISENGTGIEGNHFGDGTTISLTNDGLIIAQAAQPGRFCGVSLSGDGYVTNAYGATIAGAVGLQINGYGSVLNEGTIIGNDNSPAYLNLQNGLILGTGTISNSASGLVEAAEKALYITGSGTVTNAGTVTGQQAGLFAVADATLTNSGAGASIYGGLVGVDIQSTTANITNQGTIAANAGYAVQVESGTITNAAGAIIISQHNDAVFADDPSGTTTLTNDGTMIGDSDGVALLGAGDVVNGAGATIAGIIGLDINGYGSVENQGIITGTTNIGVYLRAGGYLYNSGSGASIYGQQTGVFINNGAGTLINQGTIAANGQGTANSPVGDAVYVQSGDITNDAGASIVSHYATGVGGSSTTTLTNDGVILGEALSMNALSSATYAGVSLQGNGYVTNMSEGTIQGVVGVQIDGAGTLVNDGSIIGSVVNGMAGIENAVVLGSANAYNASGAVIMGYYDGINAVNSSLYNAGTIDGGKVGVVLQVGGTVDNAGIIAGTAMAGIQLLADGTVTNHSTGTIDSSGSYGVAGATISVFNYGLIIGSIGVDLVTGYVSNGNYSIIESYNNGVLATGAGATVINAGTVELTGSAGAGIDLLAGGEVTNSASGLITTNGDGFGIQAYMTSIVNMGTITQSRIGVDMTSGYLSNSSGGYIFGSLYGVYATGSGDTVINAGTIESDPNASSTGIEEAQGGAVYNVAGGYIFGHENGVYGKGAALSVANAGTIVGRNNGINEVQGGSVYNSLGGTIDGGNQGILLHRYGSIENLGLIQSTVTNGYGIYLDQGGTVFNAASGVIGAAGLGSGIKDYYTGPTSITNEGTINDAFDGIVLFSGYVTNSVGAVIDASSDGLLVFGGASTVVNAGMIDGTNYYGLFSEDSATLTVDNSATGTIESSLGDGIKLRTPGSVNNAGMITGDSNAILAYSTTIYNSLTGTIQGQYTGVALTQGGTVNNYGSIGGSIDNGIDLETNGEVINAASGYIFAPSGDAINGQTVTVLNDGTIGHSLYGIDIATGSISNGVGGKISGAAGGIRVTNDQSTIVNAGQVASNNYGISEFHGGSIYNRVTGRISGGTAGVVVNSQSSADTIVNAGTISGGFGEYAIHFENMAGNTLIADPGAVFNGKVGGQNPGNLLALAAGGAGTLDTDSFSGFSTIDVETGAHWTLTGTDGDLANNISATAATVSLEADSTLDVTGNIDADQTIVFAGDHATLGIDVNAIIAGTIDLDTVGGNFQTIDIASLAIGSITLQSFDTATNVLTLGYVGDPPETLNFNSNEADNYILQDDGAGGTDVIIPCFLADTRILTTAGEVPVQDLRVGDRVMTVREGGPASAEIVWLGRRTIDCARLRAPEKAWPILVREGALGPAMPARDLWVSPDHCLMLDGVLIPASVLVNGGSIRQVERARVTYFHVELTAHDIMLAEGVPAESYLDTGNRAAFTDGDLPATPGKVHHWTDTCLPMAFGQKALTHYEAHMARLVEMLEVS